MPLQATSGAASYDGFGGGVPVVPAYIEDVFSTWLYTGNDTTNNIVNGIDLAGKGGLVWTKNRLVSGGWSTNLLIDTVRGLSGAGSGYIQSNSSNGSGTITTDFSSFNSNGYSLGAPFGLGAPALNGSGNSYVSWTFREQPKFFDIVTYTGTGSARTVAHNLGSVPGCIIVKRTDASGFDWAVYHRSLANTEYLVLNSTAAKATGATWWNSTTPTSTVFSVGTDASVNASGGTYVAYLFAHDAGGFGLTGTDNVISCGSFNSTDSGSLITLGYEPQFVLWKKTNSAGGWFIADTMRGLTSNPPSNGQANTLYANTSGAEAGLQYYIGLDSKGFYEDGLGSGSTYIYIAIRRGPMKVPTLGTSVYNAVVRTGTRAVANLTGLGFTPDTAFVFDRNAQSADSWFDRLRGVGIRLRPHDTGAEQTFSDTVTAFNMDGISYGADATANSVNYSLTSNAYINWFFRRAPGFFDEVCYTGTGSATTQTHNLGAVPELMITKSRSTVYSPAWGVYHAALGNTKYLNFLSSSADVNASYWNNTTPTGSAFTVNSNGAVNASGATYVAYLFATCAGVSKVFSYTGNGSSQTINCGFTGGARFVLIKRTDSTGDWYVWDSARGIVAGNDPHLSLNTTAAEVTTDDSVDTDNTGFIVNQVAATNVNVSSATYIGLAVA